MIDAYLLTLLVFSPLLGIIALLFVQREQANVLKTIGIVATLFPFVLSLVLFITFDFGEQGFQFVHQMPWIEFVIAEDLALDIHYELGADGLSVALILLTTIVTTLAALASLYIKQRLKEYFILFLILEIGMLGVFTAKNLLLFFIFFELTVIPLFFLIAIAGYIHREKAAISFLIYNGIGSAVMLIAFAVMFMYTGTVHIDALAEAFAHPDWSTAFKTGLFLALLFAFGVKLPIFPLHSWMLKVHVQAHPAVVMIHSGILLKLGAYGLIRLGLGIFPEQVAQLSFLIAILGVLNILYGAVLAFVQEDLKMVMAYSSVSHMGIVLLGIAALNDSGLQGAIFQTISHGLISALLFFIIGMIYERTQTSMIADLGGLAKSMPITSGVFLAAALANLGLPGMSGFISEFMSFLGLFGAYPWVAAVGVLGIILTAVYLLRAILNTTFGPAKEKWSELIDAKGFEVLPLAVLLGLIILIGVYPSILGDTIHGSVDYIVQSLTARTGG